MQDLNSYFALAENEYLYLQSDFEVSETIGNFNRLAYSCSQIVEKYLKSIIDKIPGRRELLHSHNLRALYNEVVVNYSLRVSSKDCHWLGSFYFDARYPGDDFCVVNREDALECLRITEDIRQDVIKVLEEIDDGRKTEQGSLDDLRAF